MALQDEWENATPIKVNLSSEWDNAEPMKAELSLMDRIRERYSKVPAATPQQMLIRGTGQTLGAVGDVGMAALGALYNKFAPEELKSGVSEVGSELSKSKILQGLISSAGYYGDAYSKWKANNPEASKDVESIANIAASLPIGKGGGIVASGVKNIPQREGFKVASDAIKLATNAGLTNDSLENIARNQTAQVVKRSFEKAGIKPKDPVMAQKFYEMGSVAVPDIIKYSPQSIAKSDRPLETVVEAMENAKKSIFSEADVLTKQAGSSGMPRETQLKVIDKWLDPDGADYTTITKHRPELYKDLVDLKKSIENGKPQTAVQMQSEIKHFNSIAGNREKFSNIDRQLNNDLAVALRKDLEKGLENLGIEGRSDLMKRYGALKEVEKQLARASVNAYGKQPYSYLDVLSASGGFMGLVTANPSLILASTTTAGTLHGIKYLKDPQRILKNMFKDVENIQARKEFADTLKSKYFKNKVNSLPSNPLSNETGGARTLGLLGLAGGSGGGVYYLNHHPEILDELLGEGQARQTANLIRQRGLLGR